MDTQRGHLSRIILAIIVVLSIITMSSGVIAGPADGVRVDVTPRHVELPPPRLVHAVPAGGALSGAGDEEPSAIPRIDRSTSGTASLWHYGQLAAPIGSAAPADISIATSNDYIVVGDNINGLLIVDKCGFLIGTVPIDSLVNPPNCYGLRIHWDETYDAFSFVILNTDFGTPTGKMLFGYATDPLGYWRITTYVANFQFYDYADLTTDGDKFFITFNTFAFSDGSFTGADLLATDKADFFGGLNPGMSHYSLGTNPADGQLMSAVRTVQMHNWAGIQYLINSDPSGGNFLTLTELSGSPYALTIFKRTITTGPYAPPPDAVQDDGTYVEMGDARLYDASYANGEMWVVGTTTLSDPGGDEATSVIYRLQPTVSNSVYATYFTGSAGDGRAECFPSVDVDANNRAFIAFSYISDSGPAGMGVVSRSASSLEGNWLTPGQGNARGTGLGTPASPYRWGNYSGVARGSIEPNLVYINAMIGGYGVPWVAPVLVATADTPPFISFTPPASLTISGEPGGPFTPSSLTFGAQNTGGVDDFWRVNTPWFLTGPTTSARLQDGASTNIIVTPSAEAYTYGPGIYPGTLTLRDCYGTYTDYDVTLVIGEDTDCHAATVNLVPDTPADGATTASGEERGVFVTALADYDACGIGLRADLPPGTTVRTRVYHADGNTRGTLLLDQNRFSYKTGVTECYVPVSFQFQECQDYEITVEVSANNSWEYWNDPGSLGPIDHHGVLRGRAGSLAGAVAGTRPYITLLGAEPPCDNTTDLVAPGQTPALSPVTETNRGMYVIPKRTMRLCGIGFYSAFEDPTTVAAKVYSVGFSGRGPLLAEGHADVGTGGGVIEHWVPIDIVLEQGYIYDLSVEYDLTFAIEVLDESAITLPYDVGDVMLVGDGEVDGDASNGYVPHLDLGWEEVGGGAFMGTSPSTGTASTGTTTYIGRGMYIQPVYDHQISAVGWQADVPVNEAITLSVYDGTGGVQGSLIASNTIFSGQAGLRWHDAPLPVDLVAGNEYNVVVSWNAVNGYPQWTGASYPYTPYDQFDVLGASDATGASAGEMLNLRLKTCGGRSGNVTDAGGPVSVPMAFSPPSPNPTGGFATLRFQLDEAGPASVSLYDVAGRRVREVVRRADMTAGAHTVSLDTAGLPSGIYFVRYETPRATLTRKLVVSR